MNLITLCISCVEWVQMATQIIIALTALVMSIIAYRTYIKTPWQEPNKEKIEESIKIKEDLIVFETSKQQTRLIFDMNDNNVKCYLLDKKKNNESLQWVIEKIEAVAIIKASNISINPNYKPNTGTFSIGQKRNWLYSKKFYPDPDYLKGELLTLIKKII